MKICKDGRIWGQSNKTAGEHLGILTGRQSRIKKGGVKGSKNPMFGRRHSMEARMKVSEAKRGDKHHNWKGGITPEQHLLRKQIEYKLWREAVFARDNWICQECGKQGGKLNAHHIKPFKQYPELRFAINNGETLCWGCHKLTNTFAGRNNSND